jgi:hypothetical protein
MPADTPRQPNAITASPTTRLVISLLLFAHLFFVLVAITANMAPSPLQTRILSRFAFYTQLLNIDLNFTPYHLTFGPEDADHRIEVLPEGRAAESDDAWIVLPDVGSPGSDRHQRYERLARVMSFLSREQNDAMTARLARAVGLHFLGQRDQRLERVRCRTHLPQRWTSIQGGTAARRDPWDPSYFQVMYDASLVTSADGEVSVVKRAEDSQVAQPVSVEDSANDARGG